MNLDINLKTIILIMEMIITKYFIDSAKETIKENNVMFDMARFILVSIAKEAREGKVSVRKVKDLLSIQTELIIAFDEDIASEKLSKEQIEERIKILNVLQEMTKSLFTDALNALNKRLSELKNSRKDELSELTKDELIDLVKTLEKEKEQK